MLPFEKALYLTKIDRKVEGDTITRQNQVIETKTKMFDFKTTRVQVPERSIIQVQHQMVNTSFTIQKEVPVTSNSELVPLIKIATLEHVHPIIRKLFTKGIPNVLLAGRLKVKVGSFPGAKTDIFYYLVPLLEKNPDYVILHVGTNDAVDHQSSDIISKIFKLKEFIQLKVPSGKVIISAPIKRHDNKKAASIVDDVVQQL